MESPESVNARSPESRILARWDSEDITLTDFVKELLHLGWTRSKIYNWLEHDAVRNTRYIQGPVAPSSYRRKRRRYGR